MPHKFTGTMGRACFIMNTEGTLAKWHFFSWERTDANVSVVVMMVMLADR